MKTNQLFLLAALSVSLSFISCRQKDAPLTAPSEKIRSSTLLGMTNDLGADLFYCSEKSVPLCAGQNVPMGNVTIRTSPENITFVTFTTNANWMIKELHLFVGTDNEIPRTGSGNPVPGRFPYTKTFSAPFTVKSYTFIVGQLPVNYAVAAHASVLKLSGNGAVLQQQTAWGDGCSGTPIHAGGQWGTKYGYSSSNCQSAPDICSQPYRYFFDSLNYDGTNIPWYDCNELGSINGDVTVAGFHYTEAEGRAIFKTSNPNNSGFMVDGKRAFVNISALRLSYTDYPLDTALSKSVNAVEAWLATKGKLSPDNLPVSSNHAVASAIAYVEDWIVAHPCQGR
jgi:hypothetical protein